jgi:transcriptional regulator with XRE-family HTH domain/quercetin dioxygenase-like cupin family protein
MRSSAEDPGTNLGERLRQVRTARGLSVRELARRAGCSASLVSQVERGITTPSASVVYALANELTISLDVLFGSKPVETGDTQADHDPVAQAHWHAVTHVGRSGGSTALQSAPDRLDGVGAGADQAAPSWGRAVATGGAGIVQRAGERSTIELSTGIRWERLTPDHDRRVDFLEVVYQPHGRSSDSNQAVRHDGREYLLVLEGEVDAVIGFETIRLSEGDSLAFDPNTPHQYVNPSSATARCLSVVVHEVPT